MRDKVVQLDLMAELPRTVYDCRPKSPAFYKEFRSHTARPLTKADGEGGRHDDSTKTRSDTGFDAVRNRRRFRLGYEFHMFADWEA